MPDQHLIRGFKQRATRKSALPRQRSCYRYGVSTNQQSENGRIVDSLWMFTAAVLAAGPFALPLLWRNPRFSRKTKIWVSLAVLVLTAALVLVSGGLLSGMVDTFQEARRIQEYQGYAQ
ncbi:MAG TPA: hypothetical protein VJB59_09165 [Bdellovibrionota bacterium]|nr:hypothetical protein [Bdellovibrionota bacterium]